MTLKNPGSPDQTFFLCAGRTDEGGWSAYVLDVYPRSGCATGCRWGKRSSESSAHGTKHTRQSTSSLSRSVNR